MGSELVIGNMIVLFVGMNCNWTKDIRQGVRLYTGYDIQDKCDMAGRGKGTPLTPAEEARRVERTSEFRNKQIEVETALGAPGLFFMSCGRCGVDINGEEHVVSTRVDEEGKLHVTHLGVFCRKEGRPCNPQAREAEAEKGHTKWMGTAEDLIVRYVAATGERRETAAEVGMEVTLDVEDEEMEDVKKNLAAALADMEKMRTDHAKKVEQFEAELERVKKECMEAGAKMKADLATVKGEAETFKAQLDKAVTEKSGLQHMYGEALVKIRELETRLAGDDPISFLSAKRAATTSATKSAAKSSSPGKRPGPVVSFSEESEGAAGASYASAVASDGGATVGVPGGSGGADVGWGSFSAPVGGGGAASGGVGGSSGVGGSAIPEAFWRPSTAATTGGGFAPDLAGGGAEAFGGAGGLAGAEARGRPSAGTSTASTSRGGPDPLGFGPAARGPSTSSRGSSRPDVREEDRRMKLLMSSTKLIKCILKSGRNIVDYMVEANTLYESIEEFFGGEGEDLKIKVALLHMDEVMRTDADEVYRNLRVVGVYDLKGFMAGLFSLNYPSPWSSLDLAFRGLKQGELSIIDYSRRFKLFVGQLELNLKGQVNKFLLGLKDANLRSSLYKQNLDEMEFDQIVKWAVTLSNNLKVERGMGASVSACVEFDLDETCLVMGEMDLECSYKVMGVPLGNYLRAAEDKGVKLRCFNCFGSGHGAVECGLKTCKFCEKDPKKVKHYSLMCPKCPRNLGKFLDERDKYKSSRVAKSACIADDYTDYTFESDEVSD